MKRTVILSFIVMVIAATAYFVQKPSPNEGIRSLRPKINNVLGRPILENDSGTTRSIIINSDENHFSVAHKLSEEFGVPISVHGTLSEVSVDGELQGKTVKDCLDMLIFKTPNSAWYLKENGEYVMFLMTDHNWREYTK